MIKATCAKCETTEIVVLVPLKLLKAAQEALCDVDCYCGPEDGPEHTDECVDLQLLLDESKEKK